MMAQESPYDNATPPPGPASKPVESDDEWYQRVIVARPDKYDTNVPKEQWLAWRSLYNEKTGGWKSSKVDWKTKKPIEAEGDDPDDCPPGMAAWGPNACRPEGAWQQGAEGAAQQAAAAPVAPVTQGKAGDLSYLSPEQLKSEGLNPLVNSLIEAFNVRQGPSGEANLFGLAGGREGGPLGAEPESITGRLLEGGGLYWGPGNVGLGQQPAAPAATQTQVPAAQPAPAVPPPAAQPAPAVPPQAQPQGGVTPAPAAGAGVPGLGGAKQLSPLQSLLVGKQKQGKLQAQNPYAYFGGL